MVQCASEFMWYGGPREVKLMANIKSARKRIRVSEKRRLHNAMINLACALLSGGSMKLLKLTTPK